MAAADPRATPARRLCAGGVVTPLLLVAVHTIALASADTRVYDAHVGPDGALGRLGAQLRDIDQVLETPLAWLIIASAFLSLIWALHGGIDWLSRPACVRARGGGLVVTDRNLPQSLLLPVTALVV